MPEIAPRPPESALSPSIIVVTAPSGSGKTTIARAILAALPEARFSVSVTTRPPREGERDGVHYHFVDPDTFRRYLEEGALLEYEEVYPGRYYGTLRSAVEEAARQAPVLLDVEVKGAQNVKRMYGPAALTLFIQPPSLEVLEDRLRARGTETEETLAVRLERARMELAQAEQFDAVVVNDELETAIAETLGHVRSFLGG